MPVHECQVLALPRAPDTLRAGFLFATEQGHVGNPSILCPIHLIQFTAIELPMAS